MHGIILSFVKVVRYAITVICKAKKKKWLFYLNKNKKKTYWSIDFLFLCWRQKLPRFTCNEALFPFDFLKSFLITYLITIAFLQCKIYSIVRRHRFQNTLPASARKRTNSWWNENDFWGSAINHLHAAHDHSTSSTLYFWFAICQRYSLNLLWLAWSLKKHFW